jgi:hypothetical protein
MAVVDTLKLARELRDKGGFSQEAAEATAEALNNALGEQIASKRDIEDLRRATGHDIAQLGSQLRGEISQLGTELRSEMSQLGAELRKEMADMRAELLKWMFGQTFVILAVVAALHFVK